MPVARFVFTANTRTIWKLVRTCVRECIFKKTKIPIDDIGDDDSLVDRFSYSLAGIQKLFDCIEDCLLKKDGLVVVLPESDAKRVLKGTVLSLSEYVFDRAAAP